MKTEVYSWRVSTDIKTSLEREARRRNLSLSRILDLAATDWLKKSASPGDDEARQRQIQQDALKCFGVIAGGNPRRSENAQNAVRQRIRRRHGR
jgi:hypothetical protein